MRARRNAGFTLVELLVAITVLAIVAVLGWRGLDSIVRSRTKLTEQMEHARGIQLAFAQMQSDLEQLAGTELLGQRQRLVADNARLIFVRTVFPENAPSQLQVVSYRLRDGVLTRRESVNTRDLGQLDSLWQVALGDTDPVPGVALQAGVASMAVRIWDSGAWRAPASNTSTSAAQPAPGPQLGVNGMKGLEMSLQLQGQSNPLVKILLLGAV
ncbi:prepilin-type N-terminal cleavage/methylation domain-containing protein [Pseudoduganella armeniaca]|uniref:Type II secretory pathway component PulJ n=1 Tax=Pseudoduganella armeniaca TaxID=2072590 RepID=A0A2R4CH69_9BURK|nr:prepilin-type N-terminal cleavage/methylation domain-containing protein [Pseudoduganella armeniaca]AVR98882.1 type II secretory pathway component PulJ [Pseudoduganella armeniaca]